MGVWGGAVRPCNPGGTAGRNPPGPSRPSRAREGRKSCAGGAPRAGSGAGRGGEHGTSRGDPRAKTVQPALKRAGGPRRGRARKSRGESAGGERRDGGDPPPPRSPAVRCGVAAERRGERRRRRIDRG